MKSKMKSKVIALAMSLAVAFTMMPMMGQETAFAAGESVKVCGITVSTADPDDVLGDGSGTVKWNQQTKTLTLTNADLSYSTTVVDIREPGVTIKLEGDNKITCTGTADEDNGIYYNGDGFTINGSGKLTVNAAGKAIFAYEGELIIDGVTVEATSSGRDYTLYGETLVAIQNNSNVTAYQTNAGLENYAAIGCGRDIIIDSSKVKAQAASRSYGIKGRIAIKGNSDVEAEGGWAFNIDATLEPAEKSLYRIYAGESKSTAREDRNSPLEYGEGIPYGEDFWGEKYLHIYSECIHDWQFDGFEWQQPGQKVHRDGIYATYSCKNDPTHTFKEHNSLIIMVSSVEPTCEKDGGAKFTAEIDASDSKDGQHHKGEKEVLEPGTALGHDWYNDKDHITLEYYNQTVGDGGKMKCKATLTCKRDSSHTQEVYSNASIGYHDIFPMCEEPGSDVMDYSFPEPYLWLTPIAKVTTPVPPTGHKLTKTDKVDSTCTTAGAEEYWTCETETCKKMFSDADCKNEISEPIEIKAKGHKMTKTDKVEPTCTKTGTEAYWTCETCHKMFSDADGKNEITKPIEIKAKGHTEVVDKAVPATCTEAGLTEGKHCSVCNEVLKKQETVPATGHSWDSGKVTKKATVKAEGIKTYTCTVCGETKTEAIPKLDPKPEPTPTPKPTPAKVSGKLLPKMTAKKKSITISWNKIKGVAGYDIFFSRCNHDKKNIIPKKVKTIKGNKTFKWTKSKLKKGTAYKAYIKAYVMKKGKKSYVRTSPLIHIPEMEPRNAPTPRA